MKRGLSETCDKIEMVYRKWMKISSCLSKEKRVIFFLSLYIILKQRGEDFFFFFLVRINYKLHLRIISGYHTKKKSNIETYKYLIKY